MDLVGDQRGQSIQIGAILLFAVLIIAFASYQAFVVPNQNRGVEFNHNQEVQTQLQDLRNAIVSVRGTGEGRSVSVQLGTRYPSRTVAQNPGPPSGSLNTVGTTDDRVALRITNAQAAGETGDFWNESQRYNTGGITYRPSYNVYNNAPTTTYEQTVLYNQFPSGNLTLANQSFIDGTEISLVALNGSVSASSTQATSVDVQSVSSSTQRVRLEDDGDPLNITFTSRRSAAYWEFLESSQSTVTGVSNASSGNGFYNVSVEFEQGRTYTLQLTKVGVGTGVTDEDAAYLTDISGDGDTVTQGETTELTLEVRDRFNNPPANRSEMTVTGTVADGGTLEPTSQTPDEDGEVTFEYTAPSDATGQQDLEFTYADDGTFSEASPQDVGMTVTVQSSSSGGGSTGAGNGGSSAYSTTEDTITLSGGNGLWTGITLTDQLRYSNANPILTADNTELVTARTTLRNDTHSYAIGITVERDESGDIVTQDVTVTERTPTGDNTYSETLTSDAAASVFASGPYTGLNVLEITNYNAPSAGLEKTFDGITQLDSSTVDALVSNIDGRSDATLWDRTLIVAAQPAPAAGDDVEFVAVNFTTPIDTTGWTLSDGSGDTTGLPAAQVSGTIYLANDPAAFTNEYSTVDPDQVYQLDTTLADSGEALSLTDADGDRRDELAYSADGTDSPQTSRGWTRTNVGADDIATRIRTDEAYFYADTNTESDWDIVTSAEYFDSGGFQSASASDMVPSTSNQNQTITFTADSTINSGETVTIDLSDPANSGIDYANNGALASYNIGTNVALDTANAEINWEAPSDIAPGTQIRISISGVETDAGASSPYDVVVTRDGTGGSTTTTFAVDQNTGESELRNVALSDLEPNTNGQTQTITFEPTTDLPSGEVVSISLTDAQGADEVDYSSNGDADSVNVDSNDLSFSNSDPSVRYKAPDSGLAAGTSVEITLTGVSTGSMSNAPYTVGFSRGDAGTTSASFGAVNQAPTASFTYSPPSPNVDETVSFDASGSTDSDGSIASYEWDFDNDGTFEGSGETADYSFASNGEQDVTLRVTDSDGLVDTATQTVSVNQPPSASFSYNPTAPTTSDDVTFDGTDSSDTDGTISSYQWDFGDGTTDTGSSVTHSYDSSGDYTVTLTVTDNDGATATTNQTVSVTDTASNVDFTGTAAAQGGGDVTFELENTGSSAVTIDGISFTSTDSAADVVGGPGSNTGELTEDSTGTVILGADLIEGASPTTISGGYTLGTGTTTFGLGEFRDTDTGGNSGSTVDMSGQQVVITITFSDGSSDQYTITF